MKIFIVSGALALFISAILFSGCASFYAPTHQCHNGTTVVLSVKIAKDGSVSSVEIIDSDASQETGEKAINAMYATSFNPALDKSGQPVAATIEHMYRFCE